MGSEVIVPVPMSFELDAAIAPVIAATYLRLSSVVSALRLSMIVRTWSASASCRMENSHK